MIPTHVEPAFVGEMMEYDITCGFPGERAQIVTLTSSMGAAAASRRALMAIWHADRGAHEEWPIVVEVTAKFREIEDGDDYED